MAFSTKLSLINFFTCSLLLQGTLGEIMCEQLPTSVCSFSISSTGKRCFLENYATKDRKKGYQCKTSEVVVGRVGPWIETDACVSACGVDRNSVGISSKNIFEPQFIAKLCSRNCDHNCPNIIDLYVNMADAKGVFLPDLCETLKEYRHRDMLKFLSPGAAPGPFFAKQIELLRSGAASEIDLSSPAGAPGAGHIAASEIVLFSPDGAPGPFFAKQVELLSSGAPPGTILTKQI